MSPNSPASIKSFALIIRGAAPLRTDLHNFPGFLDRTADALALDRAAP
jgi:hypothetical protein